MAKRVSSTAIGAFVLGSLALMVTVVMILGSGRLFRKPHKFICFFTGSLNGLKVGAPVKFRGVQIGRVEAIKLRLPALYGELRPDISGVEIPVIIELDETELKSAGGTGEALKPEEYQHMIQRGLRAQLNVESLLTGLLYIDLDLHPDAPVNLMLVSGTARYPEIPTIPTSFEQVQEGAMKAIAKLNEMDFPALVKSMTEATTSINNLAGDPSLKQAISSLKDTAANLNKAVISIHATIENANQKIDPLVASLRKTSTEAQITLGQAQSTLGDLRTDLAPGSPLNYQLITALEDLSDASRSIRDLADYLQRNPSAVVRGKYASDGGR